MLCPYCNHDETKVIDSRPSQENAIRRRRQCLHCNRRFTTYEKVETVALKIIKKDGSRDDFLPEKVRAGIDKACSKRPVTEEQLNQLMTEILATIYENFEREVPSHMVGDLVLNALQELDEVAFVRFSSVYRDFQDARDFQEKLQPLLREDQEVGIGHSD